MTSTDTLTSAAAKTITTLKEHIVEIISDSGEGAQRCGQSLGSIAARIGNRIWTAEIIPAEIRPPARSVGRGQRQPGFASVQGYITNGGRPDRSGRWRSTSRCCWAGCMTANSNPAA